LKHFGDREPTAFFPRMKRRAKPYVRTAVYAANRLLGRFDERIWLIGEGRSGTTWIAGLLNPGKRMLERFEPFHPDYNVRVQYYPKLLYRRPGTVDPPLEAMMRQTFRAGYWDKWVDQHQHGWAFEGLLVKDVFASLLAKWALEFLPPTKTILLIRNPFAVARSKIEKVGWDWAEDIGALLGDEALMADHLAPFEAMLRAVAARNDTFLTHIAMWGIVHHVLQRQFARNELHVVFYEDAVADRERVSAQLRHYLGRAPGAATAWDETSISRVSSPEQVERARSDPYGSWRQGLDEARFRDGMAILAALGVGDIYDAAGRPDARRMRFRDDPAA